MKRFVYLLILLLWSGPLLAAPQQSTTAPLAISITHAITLQWFQPPTVGVTVTGYFVYRGTSSGGPYTKITTAINALFYTDRPGVNGAVSGTTYFYVVTATDGTNESPFSNEASGRMP